MTYAATTATKQSEIVGYPMCFATGTVAAQNDAVKFAEVGIIPFFVNVQKNSTTTATSGGQFVEYRYAEVVVDAAAGISDLAATSIAYDGATANERTSGSYYVRNANSGEVMFVKTDSGSTGTSGTLTVVRGCLGTAPAAIANNDYLFVMNSLVFSGAAVGTAVIGYFALPELHKATFF